MSDKPTDDQPVSDAVNEQAPKQPNAKQRSQPEKADDGKGQTREPGYDEA